MPPGRLWCVGTDNRTSGCFGFGRRRPDSTGLLNACLRRGPAGVDISQQRFEYQYDAFGRRVLEKAKGKGTAPDLATEYLYDGLDRCTQVTSPKKIVTKYAFNAFGDQTQQIEDSGNLARTTDSHYDQLGRMDWQEATDGDGHTERTTYAYDLMGRRTGITFPGAGGGSYAYEYDAAGRTTKRTDPRNQVTTYTNNWRGQPLTKTVDGTLQESFSYYATGWMQSAWVGNCTEAASTNKSRFTCDAFGQVTSVTQTVDGAAKTIDNQFDQSGDRKQLDYPADVLVALTFGHDNLGQVTQIHRNGQPLAGYTYAGRSLTQRDITAAGPGGMHVKYEVGLDAHRRQVRLANSSGAGGAWKLLDQYDYTYDLDGNRQTAAASGDPRLDPGTTYSYDNLDRVTGADYGTGRGSEAFHYDLLGNRTDSPAGYTDRQGRQTSYTHNEVNEYTGISPAVQPPVHDAAGNLTATENGYQLEYDYENRLVAVRDKDATHTLLASYTYDALGHRVKQARGSWTTRYYYDGETVLAEYDGAGSLLRYHIHGPSYVDEHILLNQAGQEYYYLLTSLYSVSGLADAKGQVVERYRYDAYGQPAWLATPGKRLFLQFQAAFSGSNPCSEAGRAYDFNGDGKVDLADYGIYYAGGPGGGVAISPYRFTGQPLDFHLVDATTGRPALVLYHYRARAYEAYSGRFCQRDPELYRDSMDLYEYVASDPTGELDPSGRFTFFELLTTTLNYGVRAYNAYQTSMTVRGYVEEIIAGVELRTVLMQATIETAASYAAGKGFEKVFGALSVLTARYAKEGVHTTVRAVARKAGEHLHHLLPKFLDGDPDGLLGLLPKGLHQKFHGGLLRLLAKNDIKLPGTKGYKWADLFTDHPELKAQAWELLLQYTEGFDKANGTSLLRGLMAQITKQLKETLGELVVE